MASQQLQPHHCLLRFWVKDVFSFGFVHLSTKTETQAFQTHPERGSPLTLDGSLPSPSGLPSTHDAGPPDLVWWLQRRSITQKPGVFGFGIWWFVLVSSHDTQQRRLSFNELAEALAFALGT